MIRTQIQLTEQQSNKLKELAAEYDVSTAELIRRAVDQFITAAVPPAISDEERRRMALAAVGKFSSGVHDLSINHDYYLAEAYGDYEPLEP